MKYADLEDSYEAELLKKVFGDFKLQSKLNDTSFHKGNKKLARDCKFQESMYQSPLGIAFALTLAQVPEKISDPKEQEIFKNTMGHMVLSIHAIIEEQEKKRFLRRKKLIRHLKIHVLVSKDFFENIHDKGLQRCIESFKPELESESGLDTSFIFEESKE